MHLHPLLVAGFGAVVAAAPRPNIILSPILTPQACDNNAALLLLQGLDDAASICSQLAPALTQTAVSTATLTQTSTETVTATVTETDAQTATDTATTVAQTTETDVFDGPTDISTNTITKTATITETATATVISTSVAATTTVYQRDTTFDSLQNNLPNAQKKRKRDNCPAKPRPSGVTYSGRLISSSTAAPSSKTSSSKTSSSNPLSHFPTDVVSAACSCLASPATVTDTVNVTTTVAATPPATATAHVTVSPTLATSFVTVTSGTVTATTTTTAPGLTSTAETDVPAATPATMTVTVTATTTEAAVATTTVAPTSPYFAVQLETFFARAIPNRRRQVYQDVSGVPLTIDGIFQFCATQCVADPGCTKIWIAHNRPITQAGLWCVTGGTADDFTNLQNDSPGIGVDGTYYDTAPGRFNN